MEKLVNSSDLKSLGFGLAGSSPAPGTNIIYMGAIFKKKINQDFFKKWTPEMSYVLGYIVADGCIVVRKNRIKNPYTLNITSADKKHLVKIRKKINSEHAISVKQNGNGEYKGFQLQISNPVITDDLMKLGIFPRKTKNLNPINTPKKYFPDFVRGFFDGDGTVYIYNVNNVPQIKASFAGINLKLLKDLNLKICNQLQVPLKTINHHTDKKRHRETFYRITFYIDDCEKLMKFMYCHKPSIYLDRKYKIFKKWQKIKRRKYTKNNYPSKIGWYLNPKLKPQTL